MIFFGGLEPCVFILYLLLTCFFALTSAFVCDQQGLLGLTYIFLHLGFSLHLGISWYAFCTILTSRNLFFCCSCSLSQRGVMRSPHVRQCYLELSRIWCAFGAHHTIVSVFLIIDFMHFVSTTTQNSTLILLLSIFLCLCVIYIIIC